MNIKTIIPLIFALALSACDDKSIPPNDPSLEDKLKVAAQAFIDTSKYEKICTEPYFNLKEAVQNPKTAPQFAYLEKYGLVSNNGSEVSFTEKAKPFLITDRLCFAKPQVVGISNIPNYEKGIEPTVLKATVEVKPHEIADWVVMPEFGEAFTHFSTFDSPQKVNAIFENTTVGWKLKELIP